MIQVIVRCPHCGKSLMDDDHKIDDHPSIKLIGESQRKRGWIRLSSLYGSYNVEFEFPIPDGEMVRIFCPACKAELKSTRMCELCNAPMVPMRFVGGGVVQICSRRGCKKHLIEFEKLETELRAFYNEYSLYLKGRQEGRQADNAPRNRSEDK